MAVDVSRIPNNNKFDPVREAILQLQTEIEDTGATIGNGTLTISTSSPLTGSGTFTANQTGPTSISIGIDGAEYLTNITHDTVNQKLVVTYGDGTTADLSLAQYIDDTNLARLVSGSLDSQTGIATFTRDDATTFTVDLSALFDDTDTNDFLTSASFDDSNGIITFGVTNQTSVTVDIDGRYPLVGDLTAVSDNIITSADFSATSNRFKLTLTQEDAGTIEASFDDVVLSNEMETDYVPYVSVAGGNGATYTTNAVLSQSWLKFNSDTLELDWTISGSPGYYQERNIKMRKQGSFVNQYKEATYDATSITFTDYVSASDIDTAKISGTNAGRIRINDTYSFPASDGTSGQVLTTDGTGDLSWADASGGGSLTLDDVTTNNNSTTNSITIGALNVTGGVSVDANGVGNTVHVWDDSTSGQPGFIVTNTGNQATSTHTLYLKNYNSGISATVFGQSIASKSIVASSDGGEGLLFGTISNKPIYIGTNNTLALTIDASQDATFQGDVTAPTATIGGILLQDAADRSGLLEVNRKGTTGWSGIQINHADKHWSFMGNGSDVGVYDDHNGEWVWLYSINNDLGLYYNGTEQARTQNGYFLATNEFRSAVFRGTNTAYHVTPAGTSNLSALNLEELVIDNVTWNSNKVRIEGASPNIEFRGTDAGDIYWQLGSNGDSFYILDDANKDGTFDGSPYPFQLDNANTQLQVFGNRVLTTADEGSGSGLDADTVDGLQASQFLRSDTSDTMSGDLTINPSTNYAITIGRISGKPNIKSSDAYAFMDSNGGHAGLNWYTSDNVALANGGGNVGIGNSSAPQKLTVHGNMSATIYYDKDNTGYYCDPTGTSRLNMIYADDVTTTQRQASPRWDTAFYVLQAQHWYGDSSSQTMYIGESGNTINLRGRLDATIMYDYNDTAYYVNPASSSNLQKVTIVGTANGNDPTLKITSTTSNTFNHAIEAFNSNLTSGEHNIVLFGQQGNTKNSGYIGYYWSAAGSNNNFVTIGHWGADDLFRVYPDQITGNSSFRAPIFYDINNTGYYIHGDSTSRLNLLNVNAVGTSVAGVGKVMFPYGAEYNSGSTTGAIKITLPQSWTNTMMTMKITIFDYSINESFEVHCGGYNYAGGGGSWVNTHAKIIANPHLDRNFNVRFGHDGSKCCILIGETNSAWAYPKVVVTEWVGGHSNETFNNWDNGWDISIVTTLPSNIDQTRSNNQLGRTTNLLALPYYNGGEMYLRQNTHWDDVSGIDVIGGAGEFRFSSNTGNLNVRADGWIHAHDNMKAPIFYDSNNTGYYIHGDSTSRLYNLNVTHFGVVNTSQTSRDGISLYGGYSGGEPTYGILFSGTTGFGGHGSVTSDWATYFTMNNNNSRGWIFRRVGSGNCASISGGGTASFNGDVIAYYSDMRLKTKLGDIEDPIGKIQALNGFYYEPNEVAESYGYEKETRVGLSAQEVEAVLPEIVTDAPIGDGYKTVDYAKLVPVLVEAIKEQQKQIDELKSLINKS